MDGRGCLLVLRRGQVLQQVGVGVPGRRGSGGREWSCDGLELGAGLAALLCWRGPCWSCRSCSCWSCWSCRLGRALRAVLLGWTRRVRSVPVPCRVRSASAGSELPRSRPSGLLSRLLPASSADTDAAVSAGGMTAPRSGARAAARCRRGCRRRQPAARRLPAVRKRTVREHGARVYDIASRSLPSVQSRTDSCEYPKIVLPPRTRAPCLPTPGRRSALTRHLRRNTEEG